MPQTQDRSGAENAECTAATAVPSTQRPHPSGSLTYWTGQGPP